MAPTTPVAVPLPKFSELQVKYIRQTWSIVDMDLPDILEELREVLKGLVSKQFEDVDATQMVLDTHAILFGSIIIEAFQTTPVPPSDLLRFRRRTENAIGLYGRLFDLPLLTDNFFVDSEKFIPTDEVQLVILLNKYDFPAVDLIHEDIAFPRQAQNRRGHTDSGSQGRSEAVQGDPSSYSAYSTSVKPSSSQ